MGQKQIYRLYRHKVEDKQQVREQSRTEQQVLETLRQIVNARLPSEYREEKKPEAQVLVTSMHCQSQS